MLINALSLNVLSQKDLFVKERLVMTTMHVLKILVTLKLEFVSTLLSLVMTKTHVLKILVMLRKDVLIPKSFVMMEMLVPKIFAFHKLDVFTKK